MGLPERAMTNRAGAILIAAALLCSSQAVFVSRSQAQSQAQSSDNGISNFLGNIFQGPKSASTPQAAPGPDGTPPPWSGEDGASGHPLMTAAAIRQAAANFGNCVAAMWPDAARRNITQQNFDRYIIASIWGVESNYSTQMGDRNVLNSTATLACIGRRQGYFKDEFLTALEILNRGDLRPEQMRGSWAGAFGPTQF